jgi:hypothetical protein
MKRSIVALAGLGIVAGAAFAHPDGGMEHGMMMRGMRGGMGGPMGAMHGDPQFQADMRLVHEMLASYRTLKRSVTNLPDGIRTVTESGDAQAAQALKAHVASMQQRLAEGRIFNLFSPTLPVLFEKKDRIRTAVETTARGVIVTQTSADAEVVAALQAHAIEVSELAAGGMAAMHRAMQAARHARR